MIYQNVLEIRLMIIKCDLTDGPYTAFLVSSFFARNLYKIADFSSCFFKQELTQVAFRKLKMILETYLRR